MLLLWQVPKEIKLAGSGEPTKIREEPAIVEPARVEKNLPELKGTCQSWGEPANLVLRGTCQASIFQ